MLSPGDPAPSFTVRSITNPALSLDQAAGRYIVLCFFGSASQPVSRRILDGFEQAHVRFDGASAIFCGISADPNDEKLGRVRKQWAGIEYLWDFDLKVSRLFGAADPESPKYTPHTLILDYAMRTVAAVPFDQYYETHAARVLQVLDRLPPVNSVSAAAPVLQVPAVFEPEFCRMLVELFERNGGEEIGVLREQNGQTIRVSDPRVKRRTDYEITDPSILDAINTRLRRRLVPEIKKAFQFNATRTERYLIGCYDSATGGHFRPHRDDTTRGSAHRRFATTINLNTEQYEGGELRFPEFGVRSYRGPTGGAIVFSCSLLHEVIPVTRGKRYAFLPFLFDEEAERIREENRKYISTTLQTA